MFYVIKRGNDYNVVMENLLKETDTILFKSPSPEIAWRKHDEYCDDSKIYTEYFNKQIINGTIVKGADE